MNRFGIDSNVGNAFTPGELLNMSVPQSIRAPLAQSLDDAIGAGTGAAHPQCECVTNQLAEFLYNETGQALPPSEAGALYAQCVVDPSAFMTQMGAVGANLEGCKPWYMRRTTWLIGGAAVLGLVAYKVLL